MAWQPLTTGENCLYQLSRQRIIECVTEETETVTLWRPTGPEELALVKASGWREWPPRLPGQPIFYPVLNEQYATMIARDWNVRQSGAGYVTRASGSAGLSWTAMRSARWAAGPSWSVGDHVIPQACAHVIPQVLACVCFT